MLTPLCIVIEDGLALSGKVWPASYQCMVYGLVPDTWVTNEQGLREDKLERLLEQQYGPTWRYGNDDGSQYVIQRLDINVLDTPKALADAQEAIDEDDASRRYWFYLVDEQETFTTVDKTVFFARAQDL